MKEKTDVIIIGAGPVGLFAVFQCGMLGMKCHVIDALDLIGGQCSVLYPDKPIYDIPAYPIITGQELIDKLSAQIAPFKPTFHLNNQVTEIYKSEDSLWTVKTSDNKEITGKAIIIAAGVGAFAPRRVPIQNIEEYEGKTVLYWVSDKTIFNGKKVVVFGGGDSALDWAIALSGSCESVTLVHRRDKFRGMQASIDKMNDLAQKGTINKITGAQIQSIEGQNGQLNNVTIADLDGNLTKIETDYILAFFGLSQSLGPIADWELGIDKKHINVDVSTMETNLNGVFAIGDIATYPNKLKLILSGFAEGATAAHEIRKICFPNQAFHFEYSTTSGIKTG